MDTEFQATTCAGCACGVAFGAGCGFCACLGARLDVSEVHKAEAKRPGMECSACRLLKSVREV